MRFFKENNSLCFKHQYETMMITPWGKNALRVRATKYPQFTQHDWALEEAVPDTSAEVSIEINEDNTASIQNGRLRLDVDASGILTYYRDGKKFIKEYHRDYDQPSCPESRCLRIRGREYKAIIGGDYTLKVRFESNNGEKIYGMGQYQQEYLDLKGCTLELAQRNSQVSIPFAVSSLGYGFLWNHPGVGTATFGKNYTEWEAKATKQMDYWITVDDNPAKIMENYTEVTGRTPMFPEELLGLWQCKLRYRNQQEILEVAREHKRRGLPMDAIVVDFFHWTMQGEFKFEPRDWPDPDAMVKELKELGIETVVSVWPTIDERSENYGEMAENGYLVQTDRGNHNHMTWMGNIVFYDPTNPGAREFVWKKCKENYYKKGIRIFWLDEAEPEYGPYDFDNYRYYAGPALQCTNIYPLMYAKGFYDGLKAEGEKDILSLVRCAWAGSQKYGVLTWSGDIHSSFRAMKEQLQAGLNMGMAGIPWWTSDIGGFIGGDITDPAFKELLMRWFAWGAFCPVFRMHGERSPWYEREQEFINGVRQLTSGQDNEVWSFGEDNYEIMKKFLFIRENLRDYVRQSMENTSKTGEPVMRPLFFDFPEDPESWKVETAYMFGRELLVSPVTEAGVKVWKVYLPKGSKWTEAATGKEYEGGRYVEAYAPIDIIPVFVKDGADLNIYKA